MSFSMFHSNTKGVVPSSSSHQKYLKISQDLSSYQTYVNNLIISFVSFGPWKTYLFHLLVALILMVQTRGTF